jgi:hypothetical protein
MCACARWWRGKWRGLSLTLPLRKNDHKHATMRLFKHKEYISGKKRPRSIVCNSFTRLSPKNERTHYFFIWAASTRLVGYCKSVGNDYSDEKSWQVDSGVVLSGTRWYDIFMKLWPNRLKTIFWLYFEQTESASKHLERFEMVKRILESRSVVRVAKLAPND